MSRLSRFKKEPALKLPKSPMKSYNPTSNRGDDDDDDFIKRTIKIKPINRVSQSQPKSSRPNPKPVEESFSNYFSKVGESSESKAAPEEDKSIISKVKKDNKHGDVSSCSGSYSCQTSQGSKKAAEDEDIIEDALASAESVAPCSSADDLVQGPKTKCPFCFKDLPNKLVGTSHIKSCAKDLSTEQIIKVMELYERQIEEWKELGIDHPAFAALSIANKKTAAGKAKKNPSGRGKGGSGRKKHGDEGGGGGGADPDIELALALSISLHEEVNSRRKKGKEAELKLRTGAGQSKSKVEVAKSGTSTDLRIESIETKPLPPVPRPSKTLQAPAPVVRRRGKKIQLNTLPLYTVSESEKKVKVAEKVARILEEAEAATHEKFYVREEGLVEKLGVPKRLQQFQNKECTLWNLAQGGPEIPNESFSVLNYSKSSSKELEKSVNIPDAEKLDMKNEEETDSHLLPPSPVNSSALWKRDVTKELEPGKKEEIVEFKKFSRKRQTSAYPPREALEDLPSTVRDIALLLYERMDCDLILYGREEKRIKCHKLIITARCPRLLKDLIVETKNGQKRAVIPLTDYSHETVHAFVWYLYTGRTFSLKENLLKEVKELGKNYGMKVEAGERGTTEQITCHKSTKEVTAQTTSISCSESSTMTENTSHEILRNDSFDLNKGTQELFTTIMDSSSSSALTVVSPCASPVHLVEELVPSPNNKAMWNCSDIIDDDQSSTRDLFEEFDADVQQPDLEEKGEFDKLCITQNSFRHIEEIVDESITISDYDNGIEMDDIGSPDVSQQHITSTERKRSRSVSPCDFEYERSSQLFSATQAAFIVKKEKKPTSMAEVQLGQNLKDDEVDVIFHANKKQKLDVDNNFSSIDSGFSSEYRNNRTSKERADKRNVDCIDLNDEDKFETFSGEDAILLNAVSEFENNFSSNSKSKVGCADAVTPTISQNRLKFRSGSTPNLSGAVTSNSNHYSFSQHKKSQFSPIDDDDPFGADDTFFANLNIPEIPTVPEKISPVLCVGNSNVVSIDVSTPPTRVGRRLSPRNLSLEEDHGSDADILPKGGKRGIGRQKEKNCKETKTKSKAAPKLKLPPQLPPSSHDNEPTNFNLSQPALKLPPAKSSNSSSSPLLNYSLIDTPILKQELKKYGLKPLPRSKAKVLLRHIYHETHK